MLSSRQQSKTVNLITKQAKVHFKNEKSCVDEFEVRITRFLPAAYVTEDPTKTVTSVSPLRFCFLLFHSVFLIPLCFPMDPLLRPEYLLFLLEHGERSLEGYTRLFLVFANLSSYPDDALCAFYDASLNSVYRAQSSEEGPQANFAAFVEWTWRDTDPRSPSVPRGISPVPLRTQCPAHHFPAARSACPSPLLTETWSPLRPTSHRRMERQC